MAQLRLQINWRFFETRDQSFDYSEKQPPPQGLWKIHAIDLPDDVLEKLYFKNAAKLIPGLQSDSSNRRSRIACQGLALGS